MDGEPAEFEIRNAVIMVQDRPSFLARLRAVMQDTHTTIICFNAECLAGRRHAEAAIFHALRSLSTGSSVAKTLEMEALLYSAGTRQCADAAAFGIHEGENHTYVCCSPKNAAVWDALLPLVRFVEDDWYLPDQAQIRHLTQLYRISDEELAAAGGESRLQDLVIERVALLDAYK